MREEAELELYVTGVLRELGVPTKLHGHRYLREAIIMLINDMNIANSITKGLYYDIAKVHNSSVILVERAIRTAVSVSWERGNKKAIQEIFGYSVSNRKKPCNSEYMVQIADKIRLDRKYYKTE